MLKFLFLLVLLPIVSVKAHNVSPYFKWNHNTFSLESIPVPDDWANGASADQEGFYDYTYDIEKNNPAAFDKFVRKPPKHWGQVLQDAVVAEVLNKSEGYFVDLAANDWIDLSNSLLLEVEHHWRGLCIEPNPAYLKNLLRNRRCQVVVSPISSQSNMNIKFRFDGVFGGIVDKELDNKEDAKGLEENNAQEVSLYTAALGIVLHDMNAPHIIDYLSLDVEGAEFLALQHHDFGLYRFNMISVERPVQHIHKLLTANGYHWLAHLGDFGDCMYIHESVAGFEKHMKTYADRRGNVRWPEGGPFEPETEHEYMYHTYTYHLKEHEFVHQQKTSN